MGRRRVAVLAGVGDDEHVVVGGALLHLLSCSATFGAAAAVVIPVDKYNSTKLLPCQNIDIRRR